MAQPVTLVNDLRNASVGIIDAMERFAAVRKRYIALGGATFIAPFFKTTAPDPKDPNATIEVTRTDIDVSATETADMVNSYDALEAVLAAGHRTNLSKATR